MNFFCDIGSLNLNLFKIFENQAMQAEEIYNNQSCIPVNLQSKIKINNKIM